MKLTFVAPRAELRSYIRAIWILNSPVGMPASDGNLAAPNGCPKLIFNLQNSIDSVVEGKFQKSKEHSLYFVGTRESSVLVRTNAGPISCIGIEFSPHGAYPIFGVPMIETVNNLWTADDFFQGRLDRRIGSRHDFFDMLGSLSSPVEVIGHIQEALVKMLMKRQLSNRVVEYCVNALRSADGLTSISDLERKTGYTRRYLEILFKDYVGLSPKVLAGIFRFQKFYRTWALGRSYDEVKKELYEYYYDQSHFVKEFKRMTGFSPQQFTHEVANEFGRRLTLH